MKIDHTSSNGDIMICFVDTQLQSFKYTNYVNAYLGSIYKIHY